MNEYDENDEMVEEQVPEFVVPALPMPRQWSWNTEKLLWVAGGVTAVGFIAWFLMAYTSAKARAIAEAVTDNDGS